MFTTISELRKEMMLRKKSNPKEAQILVMLLAETLNTAKSDGNREVVDADIVTAIKRMYKMAEQSKALNVEGAEFEVEFLSQYIPKTLTADETRRIVAEAKISLDNNVGAIMKHLKATYGDTVDMKLVNQVMKES